VSVTGVQFDAFEATQEFGCHKGKSWRHTGIVRERLQTDGPVALAQCFELCELYVYGAIGEIVLGDLGWLAPFGIDPDFAQCASLGYRNDLRSFRLVGVEPRPKCRFDTLAFVRPLQPFLYAAEYRPPSGLLSVALLLSTSSPCRWHWG
jgi:hypothetical protein